MNARAISIQAFVCAACLVLLSTIHASSSRLVHGGAGLTAAAKHAIRAQLAETAHVSVVWATLVTVVVAVLAVASRGLDLRRAGAPTPRFPGTAAPRVSHLNLDLALWIVVLAWLRFFAHRVPVVGGITVPLVDASTVQAMFVLPAAGAGAVYLSSLLDRYYVRPRMSGGHWDAAMPCHPYGRKPNWRRVTQIWLLHRLLSYLAVVAAGAGMVILPLAHWLGGLTQADIAAIAAAATILAGYYLSRAAPVIAFVENPPVSVGDVIDVAEEFETEIGFSSYYVVDVSVEGLKLRRLPPQGALRTHDRLLDINDVSRLLRARDVDHKPCASCCQLVNVHCRAVSGERNAPAFRRRVLPLWLIDRATRREPPEAHPASEAGASQP